MVVVVTGLSPVAKAEAAKAKKHINDFILRDV